MIPQGSAAVNDLFFTSTISAVNYAASCQAVQDAGEKAISSIQAQITTVTNQIAKIAPFLDPPLNPSDAVAWITKFIAPMAAASATLSEQLGKLETKLGELQGAIDAQKAKLGCP